MVLGGGFESFLRKMNRISTSTNIFQTGLIQPLRENPNIPLEIAYARNPLAPPNEGYSWLKVLVEDLGYVPQGWKILRTTNTMTALHLPFQQRQLCHGRASIPP